LFTGSLHRSLHVKDEDVLPKTYIRFENSILRALLRIFNGIPMDIETVYHQVA
jgi:hypothetical protein